MIKPPTSGAVAYASAFTSAPAGYSSQSWGGTATNFVVAVTGAYDSRVTANWKTLSSLERKLAPKQPFYYLREVREEQPGLSSSSVRRSWGVDGPWTTKGNGWSACLGSSNNQWLTGNRFPFLPTNARAKALAKVQKKISAKSTDIADTDGINTAISFAERRQAVDMISKRLSTLVNVARSLKKGNLFEAYRQMGLTVPGSYTKKRYRARDQAKQWSDLWLEAHWGWKPLVSDIYGAAELIARCYRDEVPYRFVGSSQQVITSKGRIMRTGGIYVSGSPYREEVVEETILERVKFVIEAVVDDTAKATLAQTGLTNPAAVLWEITPWSAVIDWVWPLGSYLEQLSYAHGMRFRSGTESIKRVGVAHTRHVLTGRTPEWSDVITGGDRYVILSEKRRTVLTSFPYQKLPSFQPQLGVQRALTAISLLTQVFDRKLPDGRRR